MLVLELILEIVDVIVAAFEIVLLVYCVSTWFIRDPFNKFLNFLRVFVDPVLDPVRAILDRIPFLQSLPIDFSSLIVFFLCHFLRSII